MTPFASERIPLFLIRVGDGERGGGSEAAIGFDLLRATAEPDFRFHRDSAMWTVAAAAAAHTLLSRILQSNYSLRRTRTYRTDGGQMEGPLTVLAAVPKACTCVLCKF